MINAESFIFILEAIIWLFFQILEHIVFSCQVLKYNRFGMKQTRNLLLTTHQISNVKDRGKCSPFQRNRFSIHKELIKCYSKLFYQQHSRDLFDSKK